MNTFVLIASICIGQVVTAEDTSSGIVMIFPFLLVFIPVQLLTEGRESTANANQAVCSRITIFSIERCISTGIGVFIYICRLCCLSTRNKVFKGSFRSRPPNQIFTITCTAKRTASGISIFSSYNSSTKLGIAIIRGSVATINIKIFIVFIFTSMLNTIWVSSRIYTFFLPLNRINNSRQFRCSSSCQGRCIICIRSGVRSTCNKTLT